MKPFHHLVFFLFTFCIASAQKKDVSIHLKSGRVSLEAISTAGIAKINQKASKFNQTGFVLIQFESIPTEETKRNLAARGITLLDYIPQNTYTASIKGLLRTDILKKARVRAVLDPKPQQKMFRTLVEASLKSDIKEYREVWVSFPKSIEAAEVVSQLKSLNYNITATDFLQYRILSLKIPNAQLNELASLPFIEFIQPAPPQDQPLNFNSRSMSRSNILNAPTGYNGRGLNGEGVVVGIGDNANVQSHIDFSGRLIDHAQAASETHGTHVTGIVGGGGIINELYRGYVPKATIISQTFSNIIFNAPTYVQQYGMIATNNSYGYVAGCDFNGTYDLNSRILDQQAIDYPYLQNVFASGNSGALSCVPSPAGFRTVLGGYQSAKNIITVGNLDVNDNIYYGSSKGPVKDGRIKPDISALGNSVASTFPNNSYGSLAGTSMSAPGVTGGVALLYQRYRQLHNNANPKSALVKALLCNGATDKGSSGPDFSYGFGSMNLLRSVEMLEKNQFINDNVLQGSEKKFTIQVPSNTVQLKVMLYWNDPAASTLSEKTLVNDLDLKVISPRAQVVFPKILDTLYTNISAPAITGPDHVNNIEQVSIDNPEQGIYTVHISGTEITQNPAQEFFVVYDIIPEQLILTYPAGGEGLVPGENTRISWESYGEGNSDFSLEYSTDNGNSWSGIASGLNPTARFFYWTVPTTVTDKALIRITRGASGQKAVSNSFNIIGIPVVSLLSVQCEGYFNIKWTAVAKATDYEILLLKGDEMVPVGVTSSNTYTLSGLSKDSTYWISVRARINGRNGRRASAISRKPANGTCAGSISDHRLKLNAIISPSSGRKFTSSELSNSSEVAVEIKNLDDQPVNGFNVKYSIDGGENWISEDVSQIIEAGKVYMHSFSTPADLSLPGIYQVMAVVRANSIDNSSQYDTLIKEVRHLDNQPIDLTRPFVDDFETALPETYISGQVGLKGLDRYDFSASTSLGRLRTSFNSGFASSGERSINLDAYKYVSTSNVNSLVGTFNLANYNAIQDELRLSFRACNHAQEEYTNNKVWVRQDERSKWIEVYDLNVNASNFKNRFGSANDIRIGDSLLKYGQNFSSSFQIRWGQEGQSATINETDNDGYTFDDITIYKAIDDVQLVSIDNIDEVICGTNNSFPLKITLHNRTKFAIGNIPVKYSINNGNWVSETIASLDGNATFNYTFKELLSYPAVGSFKIKVIVDVATDNFRLNDTLSKTFHVLPLVNSFPYLENFEKSNGAWYTEGDNDSWGYGIPASPKIKRSASGLNCWKTNLNGYYNNNELSYLYSPCFDLSGLKNPTLSFSIALDIERCGDSFCDAAWIEYSEDGRYWERLMSKEAFNWYTNGAFWNTENHTKWQVASVPLPDNLASMRFRFVMLSDAAVNREGIAIDDIHIYSKEMSIYDGETLPAPIVQTTTGKNGWIDFISDGKLIASMKTNNQDLGVVSLDVFMNKAKVRNNNYQYYLDRSFTIFSSKPIVKDSVGIRLYFLNSEADELINASGCDCPNPENAYELGIAKYHDADNQENGSIEDNLKGFWSFYPASRVNKIPYDKGYYTELALKDFSEFWLSLNPLGSNIALPVDLLSFSVARNEKNNAVLTWKVENETGVSHYEIEMAKGTYNSTLSSFEKIGQVASEVNNTQVHQYAYTDEELIKSGIIYYRLKIVDINGSYRYSDIRSVLFPEMLHWAVYPNPSTGGKFYLVYQLAQAEVANVKLTDAVGRLVKTYQVHGSGYDEKLIVDLSESSYASGVYMLKVLSKQKEQVFKLYKQ